MADVSQFLGPLGGLLAGTWGAGAVMGYGFAHRTIGKRVSELKKDMDKAEAKCREDIRDITNRLREIEDRSFWGVQRQKVQQHESAVHLIDRGVITPVGDDT